MPHPTPRLNLFALPSQTTILFAGILLVIGAPLLSAFTPRFQVILPLLPLVILLFTLWDFLIEPHRTLDRFPAYPLRPSAAWLGELVAVLADAVATQPPTIRVSAAINTPFILGTWRRRWLIVPAWFLEKWPDSPRDSQHDDYLDVVLRHELAHFVNHDAWLTALARSLLKMTLLVGAVYWFMWLWQPILYRLGVAYLPAFVSMYAPLLAFFPSEVQAIVQQPPPMTTARAVTYWLELAMTLAPLLAGALLLWRRDLNLLLRVREVYADARVAAWLGGTAPLHAALDWFRAEASKHPTKDARSHKRWSFRRWPPHHVQTNQPLAWGLDAPVQLSLSPGPQPGISTRRAVLEQPAHIYGTAQTIGVRAGVIVLLFYIIQASLLAPVRVGMGLELAIGAGFVVLSLGLTPLMLVRLPNQRAARHAITTATGWFVLMLVATLGPLILLALISVSIWPQGLDIVLYAIAGDAPAAFAPVLDDPMGYMVQVSIGAFVAFIVAAPVILWLCLWLDMWLKQRILTWYGAPWLAQRSVLAFSITALVLGVVLWLGVLPLVSVLVFPLILEITANTVASLVVSAILLLVATSLFWRNDRRWRGRCPACDAQSSSPPYLGQRCEHCQSVLAPWLLARY
jgi:hypothetical protein